ncbi:MAG: molybdate ABC transporter permease subunit [Helicobacteraceae bacterium]|jgi:molybdate transport system permease protein|nr:molybdate ABC transporter permease subunit [Helicobacteraceae bacterium]
MELFNPQFTETMALTFKVALLTTLILLAIATPIAYWIAYGKSRAKPLAEAIVNLPLVLPPSALGFYLLLAFSPRNAFGEFLERYFDVRLVFSFEGIVLASVIFSLPFMTNALSAGFAQINKTLIEAAATLGAGRVKTLFRVILPNMKPAILTGAVLTFAHTIGEFGVVLMIGGSRAGETKVASIAIYEEVESLNYALAHQYAGALVVVSFLMLLAVYLINRSFARAA